QPGTETHSAPGQRAQGLGTPGGWARYPSRRSEISVLRKPTVNPGAVACSDATASKAMALSARAQHCESDPESQASSRPSKVATAGRYRSPTSVTANEPRYEAETNEYHHCRHRLRRPFQRCSSGAAQYGHRA